MNNIKGTRFNLIPDGLTETAKYKWVSENADRHELAMQYQEQLSEEDLNEFRTNFADEAITLNAETAAMKDEVKVLKGKIKAIETSMAEKLKVIADKEVTIIEPAFGFKDMYAHQLVWCNSNGIIIGTRLLEQEEMQMSLPMQKVRNLHKKDQEVTEVERPIED